MTDLQTAPVISAISGSPAPALLGQEPDLRQTVICFSDQESLLKMPVAIASDAKLEATQRLLNLIRELRSLDDANAPDILQTPAAIAPYVAEEAWDLLETFAERSPDCAVGQPSHSSIPLSRENQHNSYTLITDLEPCLLWGIARSAYTTMRTLEGIAATVCLVDGQPRQGVLRLLPLLTLAVREQSWSLDLVTQQQSFPAPLPLTATVQTEEYNLGQHASSVQSLLETITRQIHTITPALSPLIEGLVVETLIPYKDWQTATVTLCFALQFIPDAVDTGMNRAIAPEVAVPETEADWAVPEEWRSPTLAPLLTFTDEAWVNQHYDLIHQQHLAGLLLHLEKAQSSEALDDPVPQLIEQLLTLETTLETALSLSGRNFPQDELGLDDLTLRLLWCFSRSAEAMMQLMGGIKAHLLKPQQGWLSGTLRLRAVLTVQTPELSWVIDLATSQPPTPLAIVLNGEELVRSPESHWCQSPTRLEDLQRRIFQQLDQTTPEIHLLMVGTSIDLLGCDHHWLPGAIQLDLDFEFLPLPTYQR